MSSELRENNDFRLLKKNILYAEHTYRFFFNTQKLR